MYVVHMYRYHVSATSSSSTVPGRTVSKIKNCFVFCIGTYTCLCVCTTYWYMYVLYIRSNVVPVVHMML